MNKTRKVDMLIAIDRLKGLEVKPRLYYSAQLESLHWEARLIEKASLIVDENGNSMGGARPSVQQLILEEYNKLVEEKKSKGGFVYGNINGEKKEKEKKQEITKGFVPTMDVNKLKNLLATMKSTR